MINASQAMVARYRYDPFGRTISRRDALAWSNTQRFSSKEVHWFSGMYHYYDHYYGFRFYDSQTQRWLKRDPIHELGGNHLPVCREQSGEHGGSFWTGGLRGLRDVAHAEPQNWNRLESLRPTAQSWTGWAWG